MKRILIALMIVALFLCGCSKKETEEVEETEQRFVIEYKQNLSTFETITIIRDTATGKAYLAEHNGYAGGLTVLEEGE